MPKTQLLHARNQWLSGADLCAAEGGLEDEEQEGEEHHDGAACNARWRQDILDDYYPHFKTQKTRN